MSVYQELPKFAERLLQPCPFCGMKQPLYIRAIHMQRPEDSYDVEKLIHPDLGYSFCNCKNIWYTNWSNIWQNVYDSGYEKKHTDEMYRVLAHKFLSNQAKKLFPDEKIIGKKFLDLGSISPYILDNAQEFGFETIGWDIFSHKDFGHRLIIGDFEKTPISETFDIIWASHIFEHFEKPLDALIKCFDLLNPNGRLFIAMPDVFFIDWANVYTWMNWHVREHHIFWDMESFCDEARKIGFEILQMKRNINYDIHVSGDMHLIFRKP